MNAKDNNAPITTFAQTARWQCEGNNLRYLLNEFFMNESFYGFVVLLIVGIYCTITITWADSINNSILSFP